MLSLTRSPLRTILIVGAGRLGRTLAGRLSADGHAVVIIDRDRRHLDLLPAEFSGFAVEGDARELSVLRAARAEEADHVLLVTENDNLNLMLALIAREHFHVGEVLARVGDAAREPIAHRLGVPCINPNGLAAQACLRALQERP